MTHTTRGPRAKLSCNLLNASGTNWLFCSRTLWSLLPPLQVSIYEPGNRTRSVLWDRQRIYRLRQDDPESHTM